MKRILAVCLAIGALAAIAPTSALANNGQGWHASPHTPANGNSNHSCLSFFHGGQGSNAWFCD